MNPSLARVLLTGFMLAAFTGRLHAVDTWRTIRGETIRGAVKGWYGEHLLFVDSTRSAVVPVAELPDSELVRVAEALAAMPRPTPQPWARSTSRVAREIKGKLQVMRDGQLVAFDPGERPEPEYYLVYFSAHWCGPCRRFTPRLIDAYRGLKAGVNGDRFELVFVSNDRDAAEQSTYVKEAGMPWPFLRYRSLGSVPSLERWAGNGIPCLVVVSAEGQAIFHSYQGGEYLGPSDPLEKFTAALELSRAGTGSGAPKVHRLAVLVHTRVQKEDCAPRIYRVAGEYGSLSKSGLGTVSVEVGVGVDGRVVSVKVEERVGDLAAMRVRTEASNWLFLPAMRGGVPVESTTRVEIGPGAKPAD